MLGFELDGMPYSAMDGGPAFTFADGTSIFLRCDTQQEIDDFMAKLLAGGGGRGRAAG